MINIAISGSRSIGDVKYVADCLTKGIKSILDENGINAAFCSAWGGRPRDYVCLILGGAKGVDSIAEAYADKYGIKKDVILPDWNLGKSAGMKRNIAMANKSEALVAIWDGQSKGTKHMIDYCTGRKFLSDGGIEKTMLVRQFQKVRLTDLTGD